MNLPQTVLARLIINKFAIAIHLSRDGLSVRDSLGLLRNGVHRHKTIGPIKIRAWWRSHREGNGQ